MKNIPDNLVRHVEGKKVFYISESPVEELNQSLSEGDVVYSHKYGLGNVFHVQTFAELLLGQTIKVHVSFDSGEVKVYYPTGLSVEFPFNAECHIRKTYMRYGLTKSNRVKSVTTSGAKASTTSRVVYADEKVFVQIQVLRLYPKPEYDVHKVLQSGGGICIRDRERYFVIESGIMFQKETFDKIVQHIYN